MSKSAQRKNNIIAIGRNDALKGIPRTENPYIHAHGRSLWYQGWDEGTILRHKRRRQEKRKRRCEWRLWRWWYGFWDLMHGEIAPAQTPARRRGSVF